jgi:hypothetical protein
MATGAARRPGDPAAKTKKSKEKKNSMHGFDSWEVANGAEPWPGQRAPLDPAAYFHGWTHPHKLHVVINPVEINGRICDPRSWTATFSASEGIDDDRPGEDRMSIHVSLGGRHGKALAMAWPWCPFTGPKAMSEQELIAGLFDRGTAVRILLGEIGFAIDTGLRNPVDLTRLDRVHVVMDRRQ